jgi:DUF1365 family protein
MAYCDVDQIDDAPQGRMRLTPMLPLSVRREDLLQTKSESLRVRIEGIVSPTLGRKPQGPMAILTQPRAFGLTFNPVNFVYCFGEGSGQLEAVVAEVTNTPWGEHHTYVLPVHPPSHTSEVRAIGSKKELHVSPFFGMDHDYTFTISCPTEEIHLSIENTRADERVFRADLSLTRASSLGRAGLGTAIRNPLMPYQTVFGIYSQALRLAIRRVPFHPHPRRARPAFPVRESTLPKERA